MPVIENSFLRVTVADHGAELISVFDKEKNQEDIWIGDPRYWSRHAPVLFPFVGKVNGGKYRYKNNAYPMGQHGFARDMDFELESADSDSIVYRLDSTEETLRKYPFPFSLRITHILEERTLRVIWEIRNPADEPMFFSIGGHPAFNCPVLPGTVRSDYSVVLETCDVNGNFLCPDSLSYVLIDAPSEAVDAAHPQILSLDKGRLPITDTLFDNDAFIFDNASVQRASICYPDQTPYITMTLKGFPSFGLWSKPHSDAPYVCLEPWVGRCDNMGFTGELPDKFGEQKLEGGESRTIEYRITFR